MSTKKNLVNDSANTASCEYASDVNDERCVMTLALYQKINEYNLNNINYKYGIFKYSKRQALKDARTGWFVMLSTQIQSDYITPQIGLILAKQQLFHLLCGCVQLKAVSPKLIAYLIKHKQFNILNELVQAKIITPDLALKLAKEGLYSHLVPKLMNKMITPEIVKILLRKKQHFPFICLTEETQNEIIDEELITAVARHGMFGYISPNVSEKFLTPKLALTLAKVGHYSWLTSAQQYEMMTREIALLLQKNDTRCLLDKKTKVKMKQLLKSTNPKN